MNTLEERHRPTPRTLTAGINSLVVSVFSCGRNFYEV